MKVYVASSWRNEVYPRVVEALREAGHEVYDFRHQSVSWEEFDWKVTDGVGIGTGKRTVLLWHDCCITRWTG